MAEDKPRDGWDKTQIVVTGCLSLAGVIVALVIGWGQLVIGWGQKDIAQLQERTARNQALATLMTTLGKEQAAVRRLITVSLVGFEEQAVDPLMGLLGDDDPAVRDYASKALIRLQKHKKLPITKYVLAQLELEEAIEPLIRLLIKIEGGRWKELLATPLGETPTITDRVVTTLSMASERREIDAKDMRKFVETLLTAKAPASRKVAAESLGQTRDKEVIEPLRQTLKDEDRSVWRAGVDALARVSRRAGAPELQKVVGWFLEDLRNTDRPLENRLYLLDALKGLSGQEVRVALKDLLQHETEKEDIRVQIAQVLGEQWDEETLGWLVPALEAREWRVRRAVIEAFGNLCEKKPQQVTAMIGPKVKARLSRMMSEDQEPLVRDKAQEVHTKVQERGC